MDVSVVIVSWNTCEILRNCLASLYANTKDVEFEVIVVDNASSDDSVDMLKSEFPQVRIIANAENRGFAKANNQGIAIAEGRYVLLLNSDTVVLGNCIAETVSFADAQAQAGVVGCRVLNPDNSLQPTCFMFPSILNMLLSSTYLYKLFPRSRFFGREHMTWWDSNDAREVDVVKGCFMLVRREAIEQVGPMDEGFFMYAEETDWCYRFKKNGWKVMFAPVGRIIHLGGQSTAQKHAAMIVQLRLSILKVIRKHRGWTAHLVARFLVAFFFAVRLPLWIAMALFRPTKRRRAALTVRAYSAGVVNALFGQVDSQKGA